MAWVKIDDGFPDHPKTIKVGSASAVAFCQTLAIEVLSLCHANRYLTDGFLATHIVDQFFTRIGAPWSLAEDMVKAGLWEEVDGGYKLHDYLEYNPSKKQVLALRKTRQASARLGGLARAKQLATGLPRSRPVPSPPGPSRSRSRPEESGGVPPSTPPDNGFATFWSRYPKQEGYGKAQEAWNKYAKAIPLETILAGMARWEVSQKWADGYVPMPATWLNQRRWKDNPKPGRKQFVTAQEIWDQAQEEKPHG